MTLFNVCLPKGSLVCGHMVQFDHWVSVKATNEISARINSKHMLAWQIKNGDKNKNNVEPYFYFYDYSVSTIEKGIYEGDLEIYSKG